MKCKNCDRFRTVSEGKYAMKWGLCDRRMMTSYNARAIIKGPDMGCSIVENDYFKEGEDEQRKA